MRNKNKNGTKIHTSIIPPLEEKKTKRELYSNPAHVIIKKYMFPLLVFAPTPRERRTDR